MSKIVRPGGLVFSSNVVKIRDAGPRAPERDIKRQAHGQSEEGAAVAMAALEPPGEAFDGEGAGQADAPPDALAGEGAVHGAIIQSAMAEAGRILEDAVRAAEATKADYIAGAHDELDALRRQAMQDGRAQARETVLDGLKQAAAQLEEAVSRFEGDRAGFEAEYENQLKWLAMEIASKVLAKKVADDDAVLAEMVDKAVQGVRSEPWVRVEVAREMNGLIHSLASLYDGQANIEVSAVPAEPGTVHIETPSGVIDASLRTQLENLRGYFAQGVQQN